MTCNLHRKVSFRTGGWGEPCNFGQGNQLKVGLIASIAFSVMKGGCHYEADDPDDSCHRVD